MKKNVAEFLEFRFEKLKLLKRSERGESADFVIPFDYQISDRKNTSAYLQIYLNGDESKLDEHKEKA